ncbi:hypothetical protein [uncultured Phascolarctobacterium sp.]|uniref:DUF1659 domain-containing protein n=1 Tax=uncultured Phascolarctobacterium sp. TaxID=512296 RepID=UPI0025D5F5D0|nr:hypothetical protein [uncultured Phascolarctobacterium sp.]
MSANKILTYRSVSLEIPNGYDDEGNEKFVARNIGRVQPSVSDDVLLEGMRKLGSLMSSAPNRVVLTEKYELTQTA